MSEKVSDPKEKPIDKKQIIKLGLQKASPNLLKKIKQCSYKGGKNIESDLTRFRNVEQIQNQLPHKGGKIQEKDLTRFRNVEQIQNRLPHEGGKIIEKDLRRFRNAQQIKNQIDFEIDKMFGAGCINCGGDLIQSFLDVTESDGGNLEEKVKSQEFIKLTAVRPLSSYQNILLDVIDSIAGSKAKGFVIPFGSWTYKSQLYPGDVDLISFYEKCCNLKEVTDHYVKLLQEIIRRLQKLKDVYIGDIKAGIDKVFKVDIGTVNYTSRGFANIENYEPDKIRGFINEWFNQKLITPEEKIKLLNMVPDSISQEQFEKLYKELREKWLLRWKPDEILKGFKKLSGDRIYNLFNAINDSTLTKIDIWTIIDGKFTEISNVFTFYLKDNLGKMRLLNFDNFDFDLENVLKSEIEKYMFSKTDFKLLKMVKRMFSLARITKDEDMVIKLVPILQSDAGRLTQINSIIEVLILLLETIKNPPMKEIGKQIQELKSKLVNAYQIPIKETKIDKIFDNLYNHALSKESNSDKVKKYIVAELKDLKKYFLDIINDVVYKALDEIGLIPIPDLYLPDKPAGSGLYTKAANIYRKNFCHGKARPLLDDPTEYHPGCFNFCGPNTHIDNASVRNYKPYNNIDNICRTHDIDYLEANKSNNRAQLIRKADIKMLKELEKYKGESGYNIAKAAISTKIKGEDLFPDLLEKYFPQHIGKK